MICYVCEHNFETPSGVIAIVACPNCKHNIVTDGSNSEEIEKLNKIIEDLNDINNNFTKALDLANQQIDFLKSQLAIKLSKNHINKTLENWHSDDNGKSWHAAPIGKHSLKEYYINQEEQLEQLEQLDNLF